MRRRAAVMGAVLLTLVVAGITEEASARTDLWYRTTIWGTYSESIQGTSPNGIISEDEFVSWSMHSNTATILSRNGRWISTDANFGGKITGWSISRVEDITTANTGERCNQRAHTNYSALFDGPATGGLSGNLLGNVSRPRLEVRGGGEVPLSHAWAITCPTSSRSGGSTRPEIVTTPIGGLATVLVPPSELFRHGLSSPERIRFGRFFSVGGSFVLSKPLGTLYDGAAGSWVRRWEIEIWFTPCPRLRCVP